MKILNEKPPIWDKVKKALDFREEYTLFTYGDTIYNPAGVPVSEDIIAHESVHERQQAAMNISGYFGARRWWNKYLKDPQFRLEQEIEAYRAQYKFACLHIKDRNQLYNFLHEKAVEMSSPMYGNVISVSEAERRIKQV